MATTPLGSKGPAEFLINVPNLDVAINSQTADYWADRFGVQRYTWRGIENRANVQITRAEEAASAAEAARNDAQLIAESLAAVRIYGTYAKAVADLSNLEDGTNVEINVDETRNNLRTRYVVDAGALVYQTTLSTTLRATETPIDDAGAWVASIPLLTGNPPGLAATINETNSLLARRTRALKGIVDQINPNVLVSQTSSTGAAYLPAGDTSERPADVPNNVFAARLNTETGQPEWWDSIKADWVPFVGQSGNMFDIIEYNGPIAHIAVGTIPANGQDWFADTYPDAALALESGAQFMVSELLWQTGITGNPDYYKGCWSSGGTDGEGRRWYRAPKLNADTGYRAPFLRGSQIGVDAGQITDDRIRNIEAETSLGTAGYGLLRGGSTTSGAFARGASATNGPSTVGDGSSAFLKFDASAVVPTGPENSPRYHGVIVCIRMFGTVSNPGSADAAQLATDLGVANAKIAALETELDDSLGFIIVYPNGGSEAAPANIAMNSRYVLPNPFPGEKVICLAQVLYGGKWGTVAPSYAGTGGTGHGFLAAQLEDQIVLQTANNSLIPMSAAIPNPFAVSTNISTPMPSRIMVWKVKGGV